MVSPIACHLFFFPNSLLNLAQLRVKTVQASLLGHGYWSSTKIISCCPHSWLVEVLRSEVIFTADGEKDEKVGEIKSRVGYTRCERNWDLPQGRERLAVLHAKTSVVLFKWRLRILSYPADQTNKKHIFTFSRNSYVYI